MNQLIAIAYGWQKTAHYRKYGRLVIDAVVALGGFQGTAAELASRAGVSFGARIVGPCLHAALDAGLIAGTVQPKCSSRPCVYDVWPVDAQQERPDSPATDCPWLRSAQYHRHGKQLVNAVAQAGRFQGSATDLVQQAGLDIDSRVAGQALQAALNAGQLGGTLRRMYHSKPYVYDLWIPGTEWDKAESAEDVQPTEPGVPYSGALDAVTIEAAVFAAAKRYPELDGTDAVVCRAILGRPPEADEVQSVRDVLLRMDDDCQIKFREIQRASAPALWEVIV
jgi:hypothetical protein